MNNPGLMQELFSSGLHTGYVRMIENNFFWVKTGSSLIKTSKAAACLVEPEINDEVLLFLDTKNDSFIISVLKRNSQQEMIIPFENGVKLKVQQGTLGIESENVNISAERNLNFTAKNINTFADRMLHKVNRLYRDIKEFEESNIGRLRCLVKGMFHLKAKDTILTAEERLKMDSERIQIG